MIDLYTGIFPWTDEPSLLLVVNKTTAFVWLLVNLWLVFFLKMYPPTK